MVMSKEAQKLIGEKWNDRAKAQYLKPKSAAYKKAELEFAVGAVAALDAAAQVAAGDEPVEGSVIPPSWLFKILRGEPVFEVA